jgi:hypothetical protein
MRTGALVCAALAALPLACASATGDTPAPKKGGWQSGPQVGDIIPLFHPLNVTGEDAGQRRCLV